jgi:hypothetical protein
MAGALVGGTLSAMPLVAKTWTFQYAGASRTFEWDIPGGLLAHYNAKGHSRTFDRTMADWAEEDAGYTYLDDLAAALEANASQDGFDGWDKVNYTIAFVQGLNYFYDPNPVEDYIRFPIETLDDDGGDCEDTAILLAALLDRMGYSVVLLNPPGHMAVGIECSDCQGSRVSYEGHEYFYIETTGDGFEIGEMVMNFTSFTVIEMPHSGEAEAIASGGKPSGISPGGIPKGGSRTIPGQGDPGSIVFQWPDPEIFRMPDPGQGGGGGGGSTPQMTTTTLPDGTTIIMYSYSSPGMTLPELQNHPAIAQIQQIQQQQLQMMEQMRKQHQEIMQRARGW